VSESVYIETSVIGYLTARSTKNLVIAGNIETTRDWWQNRRNDFVLYIRPLAKVLSRSLYSNIFEDYQLLINN